MSAIKVCNLTFKYDSNPKNIFENVSFVIDTNWKLGFIGRNGKGKTTFLKLLLGIYEYSGKIISNVDFEYFPFEVKDKKMNSYSIAEEYNMDYEQWKLEKEVSLMDMNINVLLRPFYTLSKGEQTKVLLAILFLREDSFLLIDEPTNHLDIKARESVAKYLKRKKGFILVSHDRMFLDNCVDHILSINRSNIEIQRGNFSSWYDNKKRQDNFEILENEKLKKDISRLEKAARQATIWANKVENSKNNIKGDLLKDKGYIGHKSAKMMKRAISAQNRKELAIQEKNNLLKNIEVIESLHLNKLDNRSGHMIEANNISILYDNKTILSGINFSIENGDRLHLKGRNGCGKSSILKLILGNDISYNGNIYVRQGLKFSYIPQDTSHLKGTLSNYAIDNNIDESFFKSILRKLDFDREQFGNLIENYSEGQKKKILIAKSLSEKANVYVWDEPLNYVDIFSRMQIEELIIKSNATMIFVEHDEVFSNKIATKQLVLDNNN